LNNVYQDDGRQHVEEEDVRREGGRRVIGGQEEEEPDQDTHDDQKAGLGKDVSQFRSHVETCKGFQN
jgi:hypothetical protein